MSDQFDRIMQRVAEMPEVIGEELDKFGGFLRCESCGNTSYLNPGDTGRYTAHGWPKCCGYTMRWWTQSQVDSGEVKP